MLDLDSNINVSSVLGLPYPPSHSYRLLLTCFGAHDVACQDSLENYRGAFDVLGHQDRFSFQMDDRFAMPSDDAINKWTLEASGVQSNGTSPDADPNSEEAQTWGYVTRPKLVQFGVRVRPHRPHLLACVLHI